MKISFLVLAACVCLAGVSAKKNREEKHESRTFKNDQGLDVNVDKVVAREESSDVRTYNEGDAVIEEETKTIRTSVQGKRKGKRKVEKEVQAVDNRPCSEILASQAIDCQAQCHERQNCEFQIEDETTCAWRCDCKEIIITTVEEVAEAENESEGGHAEKRKRKVKKEKEGGSKKAAAGGKECSGKKKFSFSNCLLKIKGLVGYGDDANNIDAEFHKMIGY